MGGAYSTIAADVAARFQRLQGKSVTFVTGTDEHGEKIAASAESAGMSPQEHCDRIAQRYHLLWDMVLPPPPPSHPHPTRLPHICRGFPCHQHTGGVSARMSELQRLPLRRPFPPDQTAPARMLLFECSA